MDVQGLLLRLGFIAGFYLLPDIFIPSALRTVFKNSKRVVRIYWRINLGLLIFACLSFAFSRYLGDNINRFNLYILGVLVALMFLKIVSAVILFGEDLFRLSVSLIKRKERKERGERFLIGRRKFISQSALILGAIPFGGFIYGMFKGRFDFRIHKQEVYFDDLPDAFDGFTITQISDLHIGSFDSFAKHKLEALVEEIQALKSDIFFFTGDIVNSKFEEMDGWYEVFNKFSSPYGMFSILGNHDYGDYVHWKTEADKEHNLNMVKGIHPQLNLKLLLNENTVIEKEGQQIYLIGVENWGKGDFPKFGDLQKASVGVPQDAFKILLSHDPSHWDAKVLQEEFPPQLTLSGHTHGFQMGIETPAFRFSPSQWIYEQWAGLYQKGKSFIYVNRGLGTVGPPYRIGIWPEVTQLTLKKK